MKDMRVSINNLPCEENKYEPKDYIIKIRFWVDEDNNFLRGWNAHEYINIRPIEKRTIDDVTAHCLELREVFLNDDHSLSFMRLVDYSK